MENHPVAEGRAWIEMTPGNSEAAPWLLSMFPQMAVVNIVRSGLDVASSLTEYRWAPDDLTTACSGGRTGIWGRELRCAGCHRERSSPCTSKSLLVMTGR